MISQSINRRGALRGISAFAACLAASLGTVSATSTIAEESGERREMEGKHLKEPVKKEGYREGAKKKEGEASEKNRKRKKVKEFIESLDVDSETKTKLNYCARTKKTNRGLEECLESKGLSVAEIFPNGIPFK